MDPGGGQGKAQRKLRPLPGVAKLRGALGSGPSSALFMLGSIPTPDSVFSSVKWESWSRRPLVPFARAWACVFLSVEWGDRPGWPLSRARSFSRPPLLVPGAGHGALCAGAGLVLGPGAGLTRAPSLPAP